MRAFIYAFQGHPWNEECEAAYRGFRSLEAECILFTTNEELDKRAPEDIVVGGTLIMTHVLHQRGLSPIVDYYPEELKKYRGRNIRLIKAADLRKEKLPIFIKPAEDKAAKGVVVRFWEDAAEYKDFSPEAELFCSEVVNFVSEWRCFVRYGKIVGIRFYHGDQAVECDRTIIENSVRDYKAIPAGCSLDFGVTDDGRSLLVEMNDGIALGCYGLPDEEYAKLLSARWAELNGTRDPFKD